jgi:REP element-mobilizing transposase RayT
MDSVFSHRRSIRLRGYDYRQAGAYFVTLCAQDRACLFGAIEHGKLDLSPAGLMIRQVWIEMALRYPGVTVDQFVTMPNHLHGIIIMAAGEELSVGAGPCACPALDADGRPQGAAPTKLRLGDLVQRFKTLTTRRYATAVREQKWPAFRDRIWQRNYYEHVIRDEDELLRARTYIQENPLKWDLDPENAAHVQSRYEIHV